MESSVAAAWSAFSYEWHEQIPWMSVNFVLAVLPALIAAGLHISRSRLPRPVRWVGVGATALLLPNAPYVVTDLVHLGPAIHGAPTRIDVLAGLIPLFFALVASGVLSYAFTMHLMRKTLRRLGWSPTWRIAAEIGIDVMCAVGVALGRISRLNSWDVFRPDRLWHGLGVLTGNPRAVLIALVMVAAAGLIVDWLATQTVHSLRARLRHR